MTESLYLSLPRMFSQYIDYFMDVEGYTLTNEILEDTGQLVSLAVCPIGEMYRIVR